MFESLEHVSFLCFGAGVWGWAGAGAKVLETVERKVMVWVYRVCAQVECRSHVPYLESKLTTMLKGAFGGNSRTHAIINARPDAEQGHSVPLHT